MDGHPHGRRKIFLARTEYPMELIRDSKIWFILDELKRRTHERLMIKYTQRDKIKKLNNRVITRLQKLMRISVQKPSTELHKNRLKKYNETVREPKR